MNAQKHRRLITTLARALGALTLATVVGVPMMGSVSEAQTITAHASKALQVAASKKGSPYAYGATGPNRFDCSGLVLYSYKKAGKALPRTAQQQYNRTRHISTASRQRGDVVFFHSGRGVYHVGIYAGRGRIWHAPKSGAWVRLERIWTKRVSYGRVR